MWPNWQMMYQGKLKPASQQVDWATAAQQWIKNKEAFDRWQQEQMELMQKQQQEVAISTINDSNQPPPPPPTYSEAHPSNLNNNSYHINEIKQNNSYQYWTQAIDSQVPQPPPPPPPKPELKSIKPNRLLPTTTPIASVDSNNKSKLPTWLRDGLANIEKEKAKKKIENKVPSVKEVFNNESEESEEEVEVKKSPIIRRRSNTPKKEDKVIKLSEEEKQQIMVNMIKTLMTEILLDVTNIQLKNIAQECYKKASAQAKQIVNSNALKMIANSVASDDEDDNEQQNEESEDDESIEVLKKRGELKRKEYERKYQEEQIKIEENKHGKRLDENKRRRSRSRSRSHKRKRSKSPRRKRSKSNDRRKYSNRRYSRSPRRKTKSTRRSSSRTRSSSSSSSSSTDDSRERKQSSSKRTKSKRYSRSRS